MQPEKADGAIAKDIDHLIVRVHDPAPLFRFFTETLELPVDWTIGGNQAFTSGFVYLGNVSMEFARFDPSLPFALPEAKAAELGGIVFRPPSVDEALAALDAAGLKYLPPDTAESTHGDEIARWQSIVLMDLLTGRHDPFYFLCRYDYDVHVRRARLRRAFDRAQGGLLGIERLREVVVQTPRIESFRATFDRLIGPSAGDDVWHAGDGPALRLVEAAQHAIGPLMFGVRSLAEAVKSLDRLAIAHTSGSVIEIETGVVSGLDLRLSE